MKEIKTNAMRQLDKAHIKYEVLTYDIAKEEFDGEVVSDMLGLDHDICFKTLALSHGNDLYVIAIPVNKNIDLKKAAREAGVKSFEMVKVKDLRSKVGYERGSVSPIGIRAKHKLIFDKSVNDLAKIEISGGMLGIGLLIDRKELIEYLKPLILDVCKEEI